MKLDMMLGDDKGNEVTVTTEEGVVIVTQEDTQRNARQRFEFPDPDGPIAAFMFAAMDKATQWMLEDDFPKAVGFVAFE